MIAAIARRFLKSLFVFRIYTKHYKITYDGEITSANKIWSSSNWRVRSGIKNKYARIFKILLLEAQVKKLEEFSLFVLFNTKHDSDNLACIAKILVDTMKEINIPNDDTRYYKSYHCIYDKSLPKGTVEFNIVGK